MKRASYLALIPLLTLLLSGSTTYAEGAKPLTLYDAIEQALDSNPEIAAAAARSDAEHSAIRSQYWLDNPRFGLTRDKDLYLMKGPNGPELGTMDVWSVTQDIKFPTKYFVMGSIQKSRAREADSEAREKKFDVRKRVITAYYNLFVINRIIALLQGQRESLREVARSAESRHTTGAVPQQDEMKAHVEETKLEADLLSAQEEKEAAEATLNALMGQNPNAQIELPSQELPIPQLKLKRSEIRNLPHSKSTHIAMASAVLDEASSREALAKWNYVPDFALTYKKAYSGAPGDNYSVGIEMSVPLWFFMKQSSEVSTASAQTVATERNLEKAHLDHASEVRSLTAKLDSNEQLLQIYKTALIPQAASTMSSSRTAYQAGRTSILELLDSERSLYAVRIAYYRTLSQYVETLTELEKMLSQSISSLPEGDLL
jgi:outer membrane protein TolC